MPTVDIDITAEDMALPEGVLPGHWVHDPESNPLAWAADRALPGAHCEVGGGGPYDLVLRCKGGRMREAAALPQEAQNWLSYWQGLRRETGEDGEPVPQAFADPDGRECGPIRFTLEVPDWALAAA
jgi:hypothetical protein